MTPPLLVLDGVAKSFVVRRSLLGVPTALVRAVDGDVEALDLLERLDPDAQLAGRTLRAG